jgi:hypothetical protein
MSDEHKPVPSRRRQRFGKMAKLAGGVAGGMLAEGARQLRSGNRPRTRDLLLTPGNARRPRAVLPGFLTDAFYW